MHRLTKWFITALITGLISTSIYAAGGGEHETSAPFPVPLSCYSENYGSPKFLEEGCDRVHGIENYRDPQGGSVSEILGHRMSANPFNLVASLIFLFAILHTFMANKLTAKAHQIHEEHDQRMKAAGAGEEEISTTFLSRQSFFTFLVK